MRAAWLLAIVAATAAAQDLPPGAIQVRPEQVAWQPGSPTMPAGTQIAVLEGDPKTAGIFTLRLKLPAGSKLPPHWHPRDERVTVISGQVAVGFGDAIDQGKVTTFGPGSFYVTPAQVHHWVRFAEDTVLQATGVGPWEVHLLGKATPSAPAR